MYLVPTIGMKRAHALVHLSPDTCYLSPTAANQKADYHIQIRSFVLQ